VEAGGFPRDAGSSGRAVSRAATDYRHRPRSNSSVPLVPVCAGVRLPEQVLLEKAVAMLVREAFAIGGTHLLQGHICFAGPDEPTDARVAFAVTGGVPQHADHAHFGLWSLAEMQMGSAGDHHPLALLISPFPLRIGGFLCVGERALKERAMFARRATLPGLARRCGTVQLALAFEPDQGRTVQCAAGAHKASGRVPALVRSCWMPQSASAGVSPCRQHDGTSLEGSLLAQWSYARLMVMGPSSVKICLGRIPTRGSMPLLSMPSQIGESSGWLSIKACTKTACKRSVLMRPSCSASYTLDRRRSKKADNDSSGRLRAFTAPAPNRKWLTDITVIWTAEGWLYLAVILDVYSRLIVGWAMAALLAFTMSSW